MVNLQLTTYKGKYALYVYVYVFVFVVGLFWGKCVI